MVPYLHLLFQSPEGSTRDILPEGLSLPIYSIEMGDIILGSDQICCAILLDSSHRLSTAQRVESFHFVSIPYWIAVVPAPKNIRLLFTHKTSISDQFCAVSMLSSFGLAN